MDNALQQRCIGSQEKSEGPRTSRPKTSNEPYASLQRHYHNLCDEFPDLFKEELGCLTFLKLEVKFKFDAKLVFSQDTPGSI